MSTAAAAAPSDTRDLSQSYMMVSVSNSCAERVTVQELGKQILGKDGLAATDGTGVSTPGVPLESSSARSFRQDSNAAESTVVLHSTAQIAAEMAGSLREKAKKHFSEESPDKDLLTDYCLVALDRSIAEGGMRCARRDGKETVPIFVGDSDETATCMVTNVSIRENHFGEQRVEEYTGVSRGVVRRFLEVLEISGNPKVLILLATSVAISIALSMGVANFAVLMVQLTLMPFMGAGALSLGLYGFLQGMTNLEDLEDGLISFMDHVKERAQQSDELQRQTEDKIRDCQSKVQASLRSLRAIKENIFLLIVPMLVFTTSTAVVLHGVLATPLIASLFLTRISFFLLTLGTAGGKVVRNKVANLISLDTRKKYENKLLSVIDAIDTYHIWHNRIFDNRLMRLFKRGH